MSDELIVQLVREHFDLRPYGITRMLNLIQPMYKQTAAYGHFGREGSDTAFTWEKLTKSKHLKHLLVYKFSSFKSSLYAGFFITSTFSLTKIELEIVVFCYI